MVPNENSRRKREKGREEMFETIMTVMTVEDLAGNVKKKKN